MFRPEKISSILCDISSLIGLIWMIFWSKVSLFNDLSIESLQLWCMWLFNDVLEVQKFKPAPNPFFGFGPSHLIGSMCSGILEWLSLWIGWMDLMIQVMISMIFIDEWSITMGKRSRHPLAYLFNRDLLILKFEW